MVTPPTLTSSEILDRFAQWVGTLINKDDIEPVKTKLLFELLEGLVKIGHILKKRPSNKKFIKHILKMLVLKEEFFAKMRKLLLLRERDRSFRESCIRALKKILKLTRKAIPILKKKKIHVIISFMIEREFKSTNVVRERLQCLKFINAWLNKDPAGVPLIFAQTLVSIARN